MVISLNFGLLDTLQLICYFVMIYGAVFFLTVYVINQKRFFEEKKVKDFPEVTLLIPAFNEEKHIQKCLKACLSLNYPKNKLKVICINDGSTDRTLEICRKIKDPRLKIINKKNTGKAYSLNYALKFVTTEYVSTMDADSFPQKDYLKKGMGEFSDKRIVAVSPALKLSSSKTLMQKIQWMEYLFSIYLRKLFAFLDCQYVLPGPGSIYKTSVIRKIGGWDNSSLVEDMELAFRLHSRGYKLENSAISYVYTEAPKSLKGLFKQRIRWYRGYLQTTVKYLRMMGNPRYGNLGFYVLPINFIWYFVMAFMFLMPSYLILKDIYNQLLTIYLVGFEAPTFSLVFDIISISSFSWFLVFFLLTGVSVMLISLHTSAERINLRANKLHYISYIFLYPVLYSIFWLVALLFEVLRVKRKW